MSCVPIASYKSRLTARVAGVAILLADYLLTEFSELFLEFGVGGCLLSGFLGWSCLPYGSVTRCEPLWRVFSPKCILCTFLR